MSFNLSSWGTFLSFQKNADAHPSCHVPVEKIAGGQISGKKHLICFDVHSWPFTRATASGVG